MLDSLKTKIREKKEQKVVEKEREKHHLDVLKEAKARAKEEKIAPKDAYISLQNINKIYPNHVQAVYDFNINISKNEFIVFVGPSGCGKSTTLRMIAGLEDITSGDLFIDGEYANELLPKDRKIGMVFQNYALYPHMSVYENMAFGLQVAHKSKEEIDKRVKEASKILQLDEYLDRKPNALSGGQCQRVALGRAIVSDSKLFLMDEPLSNLDAKLRVTMRSEIVKLHKSLGKTTIYVTHDQTEAMTMANRIVVMSKGYVQQIGTPEEIFNNPANIFVATFVGSPSMNLLNCKSDKNSVVFDENFSLDLGKNFSKYLDDFYSKEITMAIDNIENLKDLYLKRERENKNYIKMFYQERIREDKLRAYIKGFDDAVLSSLSLNKDNIISELCSINSTKEIVEKLENILKEYLFKFQETYNPEVRNLVKQLSDLKVMKDQESKDLILGIRPEHILRLTKSENESISLDCNLSELLGSEYIVHMSYLNNDLVAKFITNDRIDGGDKLTITFDKEKLHIFDSITTKRII